MLPSFWFTAFGSDSESSGKQVSQFKLHVSGSSPHTLLDIHARYREKLFNIIYCLILIKMNYMIPQGPPDNICILQCLSFFSFSCADTYWCLNLCR